MVHILQIVAKYHGATKNMVMQKGIEIRWPGGNGPPLDVPRCGFLNDAPECQPKGEVYRDLPCFTIKAVLNVD